MDDYSKAFKYYKEDNFGNAETLEEFIEEMNELVFDCNDVFIGHSRVLEAYGMFVVEVKDKGDKI